MPVTKKDITELKIDNVIEAQQKRECRYYLTAFLEKRSEAENQGDQTAFRMWDVLSAASSFMLNPESKTEVFGCMAIIQNKRSAHPSDFDNEKWELLALVKDTIKDAELRARIGDLLWCERKDYGAGLAACDDYIKSSEFLYGPGDWHYSFECLKRALYLALSLGRGNPKSKEMASYVRDKISKFTIDDLGFFPLDLFELCVQLRIGPYDKMSEIATIYSKQMEDDNNWQMAQACWRVKKKIDVAMKDKEAELKSGRKYAETFVKMAKGALDGPNGSYLVATHFLQQAIKAYRMVGGMSAHVDRLKTLLTEYQSKMVEGLHEYEEEVDLSDIVETAIDSVRGLAKEEALIKLVTLHPLPNLENLRRETEELITEFPLQHLMSRTQVREGGKTVRHLANPLSSDPDEKERGIYEEIVGHTNLVVSAMILSAVEPARKQINLEHKVTINDFLLIAEKSPFVPAGHELLFGTALHFGMSGDFLVAMHILAPQLENAIRSSLENNGVGTTSYDAEGVQKELSLNTLINEGDGKEKFEQIFGINLSFVLRWLLIDQLGPNVRNRIAHGMINDAACFSYYGVMLWWVSLYLCLVPLIKSLMATKPEE